MNSYASCDRWRAESLWQAAAMGTADRLGADCLVDAVTNALITIHGDDFKIS